MYVQRLRVSVKVEADVDRADLHIDATLKPGDQAYEWMLAFWEHHHSFKTNSRDFVVETGPVTKSKRGQRAMMQYGANM